MGSWDDDCTRITNAVGYHMIVATIITGAVQIIIKLIEVCVPDLLTRKKEFHGKRHLINKLKKINDAI